VLYSSGQHKLIFTYEKNRKSKTKFCCSYKHGVGPGVIMMMMTMMMMIIIIIIIRQWGVGVWIGSNWLRIGTGGGHS